MTGKRLFRRPARRVHGGSDSARDPACTRRRRGHQRRAVVLFVSCPFGNVERMTEESARYDRTGTDEPDGTPAFAASLRPPGESLTTAPTGGDDLAPDQDDD